MTTTATHLRAIVQLWPDLYDALGAPPILGAFGQGLRGYLRALEDADREEAAALRALERSPDQIGVRPAPIRIRVHDTMRLVEKVMVDLADQIAADIQRSPLTAAPASWPPADRARRDALAAADREHPHRWQYVGSRTAPQAALWLCARVENIPGPQKPLTEEHHQKIATTAAGAADRIEQVLDTGARTAALEPPCPDCAGQLTVHGGAGTPPTAHCVGCGRTWTAPAAA
ncbi:hypothetical protein ACZ91_63350 [Streptomyces regensis]|nr:hypothetical protein ACZ91_63350 [Streptomyces regensis]